MDFGGVEALFRHQRHGAAGGAAAFAPNPVGVDVVLHETRDIHRDWIVRKRGEADLPSAIGHVNGLIDRCFGSGALDHVVGAGTASELLDHLNGILVVDIDDAIGAELPADRQSAVACSGQNDRAGAERLGNGHRE
jgi:hypothetical protein